MCLMCYSHFLAHQRDVVGRHIAHLLVLGHRVVVAYTLAHRRVAAGEVGLDLTHLGDAVGVAEYQPHVSARAHGVASGARSSSYTSGVAYGSAAPRSVRPSSSFTIARIRLSPEHTTNVGGS